MVFNDDIKFYGTFRPYQERALQSLDAYLSNDKIHIVAAPGSGKTILGLELIRKLNQPSLILVPTITIREQWIQRFTDHFFLNKEDAVDYISNNFNSYKPIICVTYQTLYSAYRKMNAQEVDEDDEIEDENKEIEDFSSFELLDFLKKYNIRTICLDECHHLRSEWWKALENILPKLDDCKVIALTATPPYDASQTEWQRYIKICGPIDCEIFAPELVHDNNLCPHQDFIYYSYPTSDEEKILLKSYSNRLKTFYKYKNNPKLLEIVKSNDVYKDFDRFMRAFRENTSYYRAYILFLLENKIKIQHRIVRIIKKESFKIEHLQILLQNVLFDDSDSYKIDSSITSIKKEFAALGICKNRNITLVNDEKVDKALNLSISKLNSIKEIISYEYASIKEKMKCVILTDYIKQKSKTIINDESKPINSIGAIPIFEYLRRANLPHIRLCLLTGSICLIPESSLPSFYERSEDSFNLTRINKSDYFQLEVTAANRKKVVKIITSLFEDGAFNVIIGTKALLGEGWDSSCINTLIMASFIGSYVLSNQTRGRAIRTNPNDPNKVSNIWHLVCLNPYGNNNTDLDNITKRFKSFVGPSLKSDSIEDGIDRLTISKIPQSSIEYRIANNEMLKTAINRDDIKNKWDATIKKAKDISTLTNVITVSRKRVMLSTTFVIATTVVFLSLLINNFLITNYSSFHLKFLIIIAIGLVSLLGIRYLFIGLRSSLSTSKLKYLSKALLSSLKDINEIESKKVKIKCRFSELGTVQVYLTNATTYEQNIFKDNLIELLGPIDNPRYVICHPKFLPLWAEYYPVPTSFKKNKKTLKIFLKHLNFTFGHFSYYFCHNTVGKNRAIIAQYMYFRYFSSTKISSKRVLLKK